MVDGAAVMMVDGDGVAKIAGSPLDGRGLSKKSVSRSTSPGGSSLAQRDVDELGTPLLPATPILPSAAAGAYLPPEDCLAAFFRVSLSEAAAAAAAAAAATASSSASPAPLVLGGDVRKVQSCPASRGVSFDEIGAPPGLEPLVENQLEGAEDGQVASGSDAIFALHGTLIGKELNRSEASEAFSKERISRSCPVSREVSLEDSLGLAGLESFWRNDGAKAAAQPGLFAGLDGAHGGPSASSGDLQEYSADAASSLSAIALQLSAAIPEPELGSAERPSVGSAGHRFGTCKPCAFVHSKGCSSGVDCLFCHLCPPGEKQVRKKQRRMKYNANYLRAFYGGRQPHEDWPQQILNHSLMGVPQTFM
eukprot:TRINITY_DN28322_c0_g1_i2.p1 TRINITY_DN28322_c0_g1~~TRINITY_DN28322_c0_g1_i2.p1  ORF type:complete len:364 (+),score=94.04 TRINITY_DN28322_c0_g1_i2:118-1209(+)